MPGMKARAYFSEGSTILKYQPSKKFLVLDQPWYMSGFQRARRLSLAADRLLFKIGAFTLV